MAALSAAFLAAGLLSASAPAQAAVPSVSLGSAASFSVLSGTSVANSGTTNVTGDLGVSPGTSITGFPPGTVGGAIHAGDSTAAQAVSDMTSAYTDAAGRTPSSSFAGDQNGKTFTPGVYRTTAAFTLTGTMTLDAQGDPNAVFIFQVNAALSPAASSIVALTGGAQAANVYWQVSGAVSTGANSAFVGTILCAGAVTIGASASLTGRALADGIVTLSSNTITTPAAIDGFLTITVPLDTADLGSRVNTPAGGTSSGQLGQVRVTDTRNAAAGSGWVASVTSTAFTSPTGGTVSASDISYTVGVVTKSGTATYTANDPSDLTASVAAVTATAITGDNTATWNPTINVFVPGSTVAGTYTATITHSVA